MHAAPLPLEHSSEAAEAASFCTFHGTQPAVAVPGGAHEHSRECCIEFRIRVSKYHRGLTVPDVRSQQLLMLSRVFMIRSFLPVLPSTAQTHVDGS